MKKAMLLCIAFLFSAGLNAATLNLSAIDSVGATQQQVTLNNNNVVLGGGVVETSMTNWSSLFNVSTDTDTTVDVEWSFNPVRNLVSASLAIFALDGSFTEIYDVTGDFTFSAILLAGKTYGLDILDATSHALKYDVSVSSLSEVPVPAALFLFAPALFGLMAFRRQAKLASA
ncbi:hypothetical protein [Methylophaga sp.]|uniref:hypothetical protein n=1 Tax=Methylophaga sp. TaxID=2024840 RepID=UPI003F71723B